MYHVTVISRRTTLTKTGGSTGGGFWAMARAFSSTPGSQSQTNSMALVKPPTERYTAGSEPLSVRLQRGSATQRNAVADQVTHWRSCVSWSCSMFAWQLKACPQLTFSQDPGCTVGTTASPPLEVVSVSLLELGSQELAFPSDEELLLFSASCSASSVATLCDHSSSSSAASAAFIAKGRTDSSSRGVSGNLSMPTPPISELSFTASATRSRYGPRHRSITPSRAPGGVPVQSSGPVFQEDVVVEVVVLIVAVRVRLVVVGGCHHGRSSSETLATPYGTRRDVMSAG